ncbi:MAG TPA: hypothetical protein P5561_03595 [Candidatus Omnitrophota bacterium]|nr:hypothetical protein [Candidatus Omnitrophota bacterium]HRY85597.1 hypothetical protein [Candidatus Omnitrophota bacterium]
MKKKNTESLVVLAEAALREAVRKALEDHARTNDPVVIYRNGKVMEVSAQNLLQKYKNGKAK